MMPKTPKYRMIHTHYQKLIESGELQAGDRLPTESELKQRFNVSQITAVNALKQLAADGYITRVQGSGSYVRDRRQSAPRPMKLVLLIIPFMGKGRESRLIESIERTLGQGGHSLLVKNSQDDDNIERQIIEGYRNNVSGILIYPTTHQRNIDLYQTLVESHYPIVFLDRYPASINCSFVSSDNLHGGEMIANYLLRHQFERFVLFFHEGVDLTSERDRLNGFMNVLMDHGIRSEHISIFFFPFDHHDEVIGPAVDKVLEEIAANARTAIYACNDSNAYRLMDEIERRGVADVYPSLLVAGFDNLNIATVTMPFITISQQHAEIGRYAAEILLRKTTVALSYNEYRYVPVELVEYNTSACLSHRS